MTVMFALPAAWRPRRVTGTPEPTETTVAHQDLAEGLRALADVCGATPGDVQLAAHRKVLSMLTEDRDLYTDVVLPRHGGRALALPVHWRGPSWRPLVEQVAKDSGSVELPASPEDAKHRTDQVLFTVAADPGDVDDPHGQSAGEYGLEVVAHEGHLRLRARSDTLTFERLTALTHMYRSVLESMADGPDGNALTAYLPAEERRAVLHDWSTGRTADPSPVGVDVLIQAQATRTPDAVAVRTDQGLLSYRELDERANRVARHLAGLGARPETLVGVCLRRTIDLLPALLGVWKSGAGYLPLDPGLPGERLRHMTVAAGCELVVTESGHLPALGPVDGVRYVLMDRERDAIEAHPKTAPDTSADPRRLAYVIYTSGSTGTPKGVMIEHRGLANYLLWTAEEYAGRGRGGSAVFSSISFDLGIPSLFTPLLTGQPVHLLPDPLLPGDLGERLVDGAPYSFLKMTPGQLDLLSLDLSPEEAHDLAGIVIAAGDAFTSELAQRWIDTAGPGGTTVATEYGPTEITIGNSGQPVTDPSDSDLVPLGDPIPNTTMYVLDELLEPVPVGVPGEVYVGGAGVSRGYLGRPALTAERFRPDPYGPAGSRLYRTGDRGRWRPDGSLEFLGRVDHQVKIRGYRVEPGEIQAHLRGHRDVAEVVVTTFGASARRQSLAAFVVPSAGAVPDTAALRTHVAAALPDYMVPAHIVTIDRIPLTGNGKVDTAALRSLLPL